MFSLACHATNHLAPGGELLCLVAKHEVDMHKTMAGAVGVAFAVSCSYQAQAQSRALRYDELKSYAGSIVAFETYKDKCVFERTIREKFVELDSHFAKSYPGPWKRAKAEQKYEIAAIANMGLGGAFASKTPGVAPECGYAALTMSKLSLSIYGVSDPEFASALQRLGDNSGNSAVRGLTNDMKKTTDDMAEGMKRYMEGTLPPSNLGGSAAPKPNAAPSAPLKNEQIRLSKNVVETAFSCLRSGITENKDSGTLFPDCLKYTTSQVEPLNGQKTFRLGFLVYRAVHTWATEKGFPIKMLSPFEQEKRCSRDGSPSECMTKITTQSFVEIIEVTSDIGSSDDIFSFRDALIATGG